MAQPFPLWAAIRTVKTNIGTWAGYEQYASVDATITRARWSTHIGAARAAIANRVLEITRPLNRRPLLGTPEVVAYPSRVATGFMQYIDIYVQDAQTGVVTPRMWSMRTDTLRSRQAVITQ